MIIFNEPLVLGSEQLFVQKVMDKEYFCGNGKFSHLCETELTKIFQVQKVLLTSSCSAAMSIVADLIDIQPDDEIIIPAFAHVGTASAFAAKKAKIVWCDIESGSRNLNIELLSELITDKTKAIVVVHYAGISCDMNLLTTFCLSNSILLIEDNAQGIGASYQGKSLGSYGDLAVTSFHQTKNIHCGEGGALIINSPDFIDKAQMIRDRGTDRKSFNQGEIDRWRWQTSGTNCYLSELQAAFLYAQIHELPKVNAHRIALFEYYNLLLKDILPPENLPQVLSESKPNGHCFSILTKSEKQRINIINSLRKEGVQSAFHYQPLHKAPFWKGLYDKLTLPETENVAQTILRLPMHYNLKLKDIEFICKKVEKVYE